MEIKLTNSDESTITISEKSALTIGLRINKEFDTVHISLNERDIYDLKNALDLMGNKF